MFKESLRGLVERTEGGIAGVLMGMDGIPVDQYAVEEADISIDTVGMEFSVIVTQARQAAEMLHIGDAQEIAIRAEHMTTVFRLLNDEYFVALALQPKGNLGKARYLLRVGASELVEGL